jgi:hypothetical protein
MYKMLIYFQIQFQLNRLSKCEMHAAIDGISTLDLVFPPPEKIKVLLVLGQRTSDHREDYMYTGSITGLGPEDQ